MVNIYSGYNGKYTRKDTWGPNTSTGPIASSFTGNRLFVNENLFFRYAARNLYKSYKIDEYTSISVEDGEHGRLYRSQLNFAIYCITTLSGVSFQHTNTGSNLLRSVYRFHIYYSIRRFFKYINAAVPGEDGFDAGNNVYDKDKMSWLGSYFGAEYGEGFLEDEFREKLYVRRQVLYTHRGAEKENRELLKKLVLSQNPSKYVLKESKGVNSAGASWLSRSVMAYVYLVLNAQSISRASFGSGMDAVVSSAFSSALEVYVGRKDDMGGDIKRFESVLDMAGSVVNFSIGDGIYLMPSNLVMRMGKVVGYNNKVLVSDVGGVVGLVNAGNKYKEAPKHKVGGDKETPKRGEALTHRERNEEYRREAIAVGIILTIASSVFMGFYAPA